MKPRELFAPLLDDRRPGQRELPGAVINVSSSSSRDFSLDWVAVRVHYQ